MGIMAVLKDVFMPGPHSDYENTRASLERQNLVLRRLLERNHAELTQHLEQDPTAAAAFMATTSFDNDAS